MTLSPTPTPTPTLSPTLTPTVTLTLTPTVALTVTVTLTLTPALTPTLTLTLTRCLAGIPSWSSPSACCAASCGGCGGPGCGDLPGGSSLCCASKIEQLGTLCKTPQDSGCLVPSATGAEATGAHSTYGFTLDLAFGEPFYHGKPQTYPTPTPTPTPTPYP